MDKVEKIMYKLGYVGGDPQKQEEIRGYMNEADEYMRSCGVPPEKLTSQSAFVIESLWADCRDKGNENELIKKDGMIVHLIAQMRR